MKKMKILYTIICLFICINSNGQLYMKFDYKSHEFFRTSFLVKISETSDDEKKILLSLLNDKSKLIDLISNYNNRIYYDIHIVSELSSFNPLISISDSTAEAAVHNNQKFSDLLDSAVICDTLLNRESYGSGYKLRMSILRIDNLCYRKMRVAIGGKCQQFYLINDDIMPTKPSYESCISNVWCILPIVEKLTE